MLELAFELIEKYTGVLYGIVMASVIMILIGVQNVARKDLNEYFRRRPNSKKADYMTAWVIFYVIFGTLIIISLILTISYYLK